MTANQTQSSLQYDPGNRRVIREASRLLVKWYSANYRLDPTDRNYLKTVVENLLEIASLRQSASPRLAIINGRPMKRIVRTLTTKRQSASPRLAKVDGNPTKRIVRTLTTKRQSASPRLAKVDGNPTKRIVRILTAKSAAGSHLTYERDLLNSRKNSHFYKTNHPGLPHGLPPYDPDSNTFRIYAQNEITVQFPLLLFAN